MIETNNQLTNSLIYLDCIHTENVERVFRSVDRGLFIKNAKELTYSNTPFQLNKVIVCSPSLYSEALEYLELEQGHTFLNIGSGIGYFNTVVGLLLGDTGINHGIEIEQSLVDIAYEKVSEFKLTAASIDHFNFCEPVFIQGDIFELEKSCLYDRIFCGAYVQFNEFFFSLMKVGGIFIMPMYPVRKLMKITKLSDRTYKRHMIQKNSCNLVTQNLVVPVTCTKNKVKFPSVQPSSLKELCRSNIRSHFRQKLKQTYPNLIMRAIYSIMNYVLNPISLSCFDIKSYFDFENKSNLEFYNFTTERSNNELSKHLKAKIDLLPIPNSMKNFLNYN